MTQPGFEPGPPADSRLNLQRYTCATGLLTPGSLPGKSVPDDCETVATAHMCYWVSYNVWTSEKIVFTTAFFAAFAALLPIIIFCLSYWCLVFCVSFQSQKVFHTTTQSPSPESNRDRLQNISAEEPQVSQVHTICYWVSYTLCPSEPIHERALILFLPKCGARTPHLPYKVSVPEVGVGVGLGNQNRRASLVLYPTAWGPREWKHHAVGPAASVKGGLRGSPPQTGRKGVHTIAFFGGDSGGGQGGFQMCLRYIPLHHKDLGRVEARDGAVLHGDWAVENGL
ncbi:hypothetical protein DFH07DRAFT_772769 [Mycena maculata]|uniref:Uncharacterized protein n=1 Tax=Mycena maculata TaxID=230809 RepID=A0AAD7J7I2_9AGAR|nr:hypothetical protein DFH07DRAFT_772769 [Mycena maculata]